VIACRPTGPALLVDAPEDDDVALAERLRHRLRIDGLLLLDELRLAVLAGRARGQTAGEDRGEGRRGDERFPRHAGEPPSARRAWYDERTSGPASTRAKPIASPAARIASNSDGV
jgi:hypothetical protein